MTVYGVTMDYQVKPIRFGGKEMYDMREVFVSREEAERRANTLKQQALAEGKK